MKVLDVIVGAVMLWGGWAQIARGVRQWRSSRRLEGTFLKGGPLYTDDYRWALERALIPSGLGTALFGVVILLHSLWTSNSSNDAGDPIAVASVIGLFLAIVMMAVTVAVIQLNRPRFVVPRSMRSEPGLRKVRSDKRARRGA